MINTETILAQLQISKENLLNEVSLLLGKKQLAEYRMETEYFEKKISTNLCRI
jgi:outer membrane protein assembly factor BamA